MPLANYDPIRNGLRNLKAEARPVHPVNQAQRQVLHFISFDVHLLALDCFVISPHLRSQAQNNSYE